MMSEAELRALLGAILKLGDIGRLHPDERAQPGTGQLVHALGTIAAVTTLALEGTLPPQRLDLNPTTFRQLADGEVLVLRTILGFQVELRRVVS